jgi:hypothetical protein
VTLIWGPLLSMSVDPRRAGLNTFAGRTLPILDKQISLNIPLKTHAQINNAVNQLTTVIQNSISSSSSSVTLNPSNQKKKLNTLPIYIIELIKAKHRTRATWQNPRYPIDKIVFNQQTYTLKTELSKHRSTKFE